MTQPDDLRERIANTLWEATNGGIDVLKAADAVIRELGLREESRTLQDGAGGITTNWRTGETTVHSRPATRQCRYVTDWTADQRNRP